MFPKDILGSKLQGDSESKVAVSWHIGGTDFHQQKGKSHIYLNSGHIGPKVRQKT